MNKIYLDPDIYYIDNFLSQYEIDEIMKFAEEEDGWDYESNPNIAMKPFSIKDNVASIYDDIRIKISELLENEEEYARGGGMLQKLINYEGESIYGLRVHSDNHPYGDGMSIYVTKGYVIYLNNNFEGGEIDYVDKGIIMSPVPGRMVVHSGYDDNKHGVRKVTNGTRYMITGFVFNNKPQSEADPIGV